jgi:hypothetical protein
VAILEFPMDRVVGTVHWAGSSTDGYDPILATGVVEVPDDAKVDLQIQAVTGPEPSGSGVWDFVAARGLVDLGFVNRLPPDGIESIFIQTADEATFDALTHLSPGLRLLYLGWSGFSDAVLPTVAKLTQLIHLQTFGNNFTDAGVQVLSALTELRFLALEEETLSLAAFDFVSQLPALTRLGLKDVPLSSRDLQALRERLPGVDVG